MKVNINSLHFKTDKKLEDFIQERIGKLTGIYDGLIGADVTLRLEKNEKEGNKVTELRLQIPGNDIFAKKQTQTFEQSTEEAVEAVRKQLIKHKDKLKGN